MEGRDTLLDFLFDNPFLLIILIGIISSLLKKDKKEDRKKPRGTLEPKPFVEGKRLPEPEIFRIPKEKPVQKVEVPRTKAIEKDYVNKKKEAEKRITALKEQQSKILEEERGSVATHNTPTHQKKAELSKSDTPMSFNEGNLIEGIIMSEVLGPPRSKRPHRSIGKS